MIHKIICPTDLSAPAQNAVAYAAKLCQMNGAVLELLHIEPVHVRDLMFTARSREMEITEMSNALNTVCREVNKMFNISCSHDIDTSGLTLEEAVAQKSGPGTLFVVGTNGADNLFQLIFGSNAFNIAKQADSPVLVIPDAVSYGTVGTIAFAWDYEISKHAIRQVKEFADMLGSKLVFLHISAHATDISKDVFQAMSDRLVEVMGEKSDIEFKRLFASGIREGLNDYMKEKNAGLLIISIHNGKLVRKAFRNTEGTGSLPGYPLLIIHGS